MERETFWGGALERRVYLREGWLERGANLIGKFIGGEGLIREVGSMEEKGICYIS